MGALRQAGPAIGLSSVSAVGRIACVLLSAILTVAFARATGTQVIAVRQVGAYCRSTDPNRVSISWISWRKVADGHLMACIG